MRRTTIERYEAALNAEMGSFVDAVQTGAQVEVGIEDGRLALILADAVFKSVSESRTAPVFEIAQAARGPRALFPWRPR